MIRIVLHFGNATITSIWRCAHVLLNTSFCDIFWKIDIAVVAITVSGTMSGSLSGEKKKNNETARKLSKL